MGTNFSKILSVYKCIYILIFVYIFHTKNVFDNFAWKMASLLCRPQYVNYLTISAVLVSGVKVFMAATC